MGYSRRSQRCWMIPAGNVMYKDESGPDSEDAKRERERLWAVGAGIDSGKIESDDRWN